MQDKGHLANLLMIWGLALLPLLFQTYRQPSSGLVAAYCFQMWMLHWLGALIHALPWSDLGSPEFVVLGFEQSTYGIIAFAAGAIALGPTFGRAVLGNVKETQFALNAKAPAKYIWAGMISYFVLAPTIGQYPGMNAVPAVGSELVIVGCCLRCWLAWQKSGMTGLARTLLPTMLIPLVILLKQGFLGFGVIAVSIILLFSAQFFRPRWVLLVGFLGMSYMGMTGYVTYMRDRDDIRATVWGQQPVSVRIDQAWKTVSTFDWFTPSDSAQLEMINGRLNQNVLIGAAVDNLSNTHGFLKGETFKDAVLAMIPRLIWPDKPFSASAGSGYVVSQLTGIEFARGTSVGLGPVLEYYGNFGPAGVVIGFFLFGALVRGLDFCAGTHLQAGNWPAFMTTFLVGISLLNVSGSLVEITAGAMASLVVAKAVNRFIKQPEIVPEEHFEEESLVALVN